MTRQRKTYLDFIIDRLTNSIQNTISGDSFATAVVRLTIADLKQVTKKSGWNFNWKKELDENAKEIYKLIITSSPDIIQGLLSLTIEPDHIFMNLVESAPFNISKINFMKGWREILLHLPANSLFSGALTALSLLTQRQNL